MTSDKRTAGDLANSHAEYNPREATQDDLNRLRQTLEYYGDLSGIVLNIRTDTIVGGHQRQKLLNPAWKIDKKPHTDKTGTVAIGYVDTPEFGRLNYREVDWDLKKEMGANLAANEGAGDWVFSKRLDMLEELDTGGFDMNLTGHSPEQLERLFTWTQDDDARLSSLFKKDEAGDDSDDDGSGSGDGADSTDNSGGDVPGGEQLTVVKVNLTIEQRDWLDNFYEEKGLKSRSDGLRYVLQSFRGAI